MAKIRALIVDDSAMVRQLMSEILSSDPGIEVVGTAQDPYVAREKIKTLHPDVLTLDVEMPKMDGVTFLKNLMRLRPMPVIMVSSLTQAGADITLEALDVGAVDYVSKPTMGVQEGLKEYSDTIIEKVKIAAKAKVRPYDPKNAKPIASADPKFSADAVLPSAKARHLETTDKFIAIGASTGGTEAIKEVLVALPAHTPAIVIAQHIPEMFSATFADRMNKLSAMTVCEAQDGQQILPGHVYIAPGSHHLMVKRSGARYYCELNDGPKVNRHKPSVDVLFRSVAQHMGPNAQGLILTGMGDDGAKGLKEMRDAGAETIAQDEQSSVVWGMPGEAVKQDAVDKVLSLTKIAPYLVQKFKLSAK